MSTTETWLIVAAVLYLPWAVLKYLEIFSEHFSNVHRNDRELKVSKTIFALVISVPHALVAPLIEWLFIAIQSHPVYWLRAKLKSL